MFEHQFAISTCVATFALLVIGALVHATGSSLACPDWPLCYGQVMPPMVGGIFYEHGHRTAASLVGLMTLALAIVLTVKRRRDGRLIALGWAAAVLVAVQGVLGGITVLLRLPLAVSTAHLAVSMAFFSLLLLIAFRTRPAAAPGEAAPPAGRALHARARSWAGAAALVVYLQVLLGAFVRHTGSGLACGFEVTLCQGRFWPAGGPAQLHMGHRLLGVIAVAALVVASLLAARLAARAPAGLRAGRLVRLVSRLAPGLALVQVGLGVATVWTGIDVAVVTLHFGTGAALLGCAVSLYLALGPAAAAAPAPASPLPAEAIAAPPGDGALAARP